jgi:RimJ/RimL family protein N-acetyltransferase
MMATPQTYQTCPTALTDTQWIIDLSTRVQTALTASGSLQELTFMGPISALQHSIRAEEIFIFQELNTQTRIVRRIGSIVICPFAPEVEHGSLDWNISSMGKKWFLHSFMLEPSSQGKGLGLQFLREALELLEVREGEGTVVLDCWVGNEKLRAFYEKAGFSLVGEFPQGDYEIAVFEFKLKER